MEDIKQKLTNLFSKKDRKKLWFPEEISNGEIDVFTRKITTWIHKSGHLGYLIYNDNGDFYTFVFERTLTKSPVKRVQMCDWCYSVKSQSRIAYFSFKSSETTTRAVGLCHDLNCIHSIKDINADSMRETLSVDEKIKRYEKNVAEFVYNNALER